MKLSKIAMIAAVASSLAVTGVAGAADYELNIFGASAQYTFWNALAPTFLTRTYSCTGTSQAQTSDKKHGVTMGTGCTVSGVGNRSIAIRYSSKASFDGIHAVKGDSNVTDTCGNVQRAMANESDITGTTVNSTKCVVVSLGASDVAGESFTQQSHGQKLGPNNGGQVDPVFSEISTTGISYYRPIVVPFGFFANKSVTVRTCTAGTLAGQQCTTSTDCGTGGVCGTAAPITGISRAMAVQIFSGQAAYWSDFGAGYVASPVIACLRHAGSGTHSTLDYSVVRGNGWGASLLQNESPMNAPNVYFNDGSADEMKCVDGQISNGDPQSPWTAIGYADGDQLTGTGATTYPNTTAIAYNGYMPTRVNIRNGLYDFYTNEWLFRNPNNSTAINNIAAALNTFASNPANLSSTSSLGAKAYYWATQAEMVWNKGTDQAYLGYVGATTPMTP